MSEFVVEGRHTLSGSVNVTGNKNEALPLVAAALLTDKPVTLHNIPDIEDFRTMLRIARHLGAHVSREEGQTRITAERITTSTIPLELSGRIRASILFASALLARTGKAVIPQPGGDAIGRRRLDTHFLVLEALGARVKVARTHPRGGSTRTVFTLSAPRGLRGAPILLDEASVTATENAVIAAAAARGKSEIANAASEPHVQGLCRFLCKAGAHITGIGSNMLTVEGTDAPGGAEHVVSGDYIEAGSFIGLAAATGSEIEITNIDPRTMRMILFQFSRVGVAVEPDPERRRIKVPARGQLTMRTDLGGAIAAFEDSPWPGFPADLVSILLVVATQSKGTCLIHEKMFEARLFFVDKLLAMGARIVLCDPHRAVVVGPSPLHASTLSSPDIRAGMALLIASLAAEGESVIQNIGQIDRGYENIDGRLRALGARITRRSNRGDCHDHC